MLCYFDWLEMLKGLPDKLQAFDVLCAVADFVKDGEVKDFSDPAANMAYKFMRGQAERDAKKYDSTCQKRAEAGRLGGRPRKKENGKEENSSSTNQMQAKKANGFQKSNCNQMQAKKAKKPDTEPEPEQEQEPESDTEPEKELYISADAADAPLQGAKGIDALTAEQPLINYFYQQYRRHTGKNHPSVSIPKLVEVSTVLNSNEADESYVDEYFGDETHRGICGDSDCSIFHFASPTVQELLTNRVFK